MPSSPRRHEELALVDELCDQYEERISQGGAPDFDDLLTQVSGSLQPRLFRELLALEQELLPENEWTARLESYRDRYPQWVSELGDLETPEEGSESDRLVSDSSTMGPSERMGPYKILQEIGQGGMGTVYMADQLHPIKRRVAVKVIRSGLNCQQVLARFEAERQALAMMDHPGIARILDTGTNDLGQPYFAMELVKGVPLTEYCDSRKLGIRERLELFRQVCEAVHHAHQKGVIHRDLKPTNILVAEYNGNPLSKVIDFGVAKAVDASFDLTDRTMFTEFGQVLGTLMYMSPEQASLDSLDIDIRSDIYSLGCILFELLTGSPPLDASAIRKAGLLKVLEMVREQDSPRPSTRLTTRREALQTVTANRQTDMRRLCRALSGDLDWVVMKAIEKDRKRRYDSAAALGNDLRRYLDGSPVDARPPSVAYQATKFVTRHRGLVASVVGMVLLLLGGIIGTTSGLVWAIDERNKAVEQERIANQARAETQAKLEEVRTAQSILQELFDNVASDVPDDVVTAWMDGLESASGKLLDASLGESTDVASLQASLAQALSTFGRRASAISAARFASQTHRDIHGPEHPKTLQSRAVLGLVLVNAEEIIEAEQVLSDVYPKLQAKFGDSADPTVRAGIALVTALAIQGQSEAVLKIGEPLLASLRKAPGQELRQLRLMMALAPAHATAGDSDQSVAVLREAVELADQLGSPALAIRFPLTILLADSLVSQGEISEAREVLAVAATRLPNSFVEADFAGPITQRRECLETVQEIRIAIEGAQGTNRTEAITVGTSLDVDRFAALPHKYLVVGAEALSDAVLRAEAVAWRRAAWTQCQKELGERNAATFDSLLNLADALQKHGRPDEAIDYNQQVIASADPSSLQYFVANNNLASCYMDQQRFAEAVPILESVVSHAFAGNTPNGLQTQCNLAISYRATGRFDDAVGLLKENLAGREQVLGIDHEDTLLALKQLGFSYWTRSMTDQSIPCFQDLLQRRIDKHGAEHAMVDDARLNLGANYLKANRFEDAAAELEIVWQQIGNKPVYGWAAHDLLMAYAGAGRNDDGLALARELAEEAGNALALNPEQHASQLASWALDLIQAGHLAIAEPLARAALRIRTERIPEDWRTYNTMSMLGGCLLSQSELSKAEPLLIEGYAGMRRQLEQIPDAGRPRLLEAAGRLIELYTELDDADQQKHWQTERDSLKKVLAGRPVGD